MDILLQRIASKRLQLSPIRIDDIEFVYRLVNSDGWKTFIGDFNMDSLQKAETYVKKIQATKDVYYWIVKLASTEEPIGLITFLKRESLNHFDLGFAFLPQFKGKGYAFEASVTVLNQIENQGEFKAIQAVTIPTNKSSIRLLEKLGFQVHKKKPYSKQEDLVYIKINTP